MYIMNATSPAVRQLWIHEINQMLENQLNFLNGKAFFVSKFELNDLNFHY